MSFVCWRCCLKVLVAARVNRSSWKTSSSISVSDCPDLTTIVPSRSFLQTASLSWWLTGSTHTSSLSSGWSQWLRDTPTAGSSTWSRYVRPVIWVESVIERHAHSRVEYMIKVLLKYWLLIICCVLMKFGWCSDDVWLTADSMCSFFQENLHLPVVHGSFHDLEHCTVCQFPWPGAWCGTQSVHWQLLTCLRDFNTALHTAETSLL